MTDSPKKPSIEEVRAVWRAGLKDIPEARPDVIGRALAHIGDDRSERLRAGDIAWGFAASMALSLVVAISLKATTPDTSNESSFLKALTMDPLEEVSHG